MRKAVALLVAAGSGERLGASRPKAFVTLAGRPMLEWSVDALRAAGLSRDRRRVAIWRVGALRVCGRSRWSDPFGVGARGVDGGR